MERRRTGGVSFEAESLNIFFCLSSTREQHGSVAAEGSLSGGAAKRYGEGKGGRKRKTKIKKKDIMLWRNGAKERKASRGGGDVKAPNIPQKHSAAVPLVAVQSVKAVGFQYKLIFSSSFYRVS